MAITPRSMVGLPNSPSFRYKQLNPAYQSDPRRILGQSLMTQGSSSAPVRTPLQGLGRLSSALVGAYLQKGAMDRQVTREDEYKDQLSNALSGMNLPANSPINALSAINPELGISAAVARQTALDARKPIKPNYVNVYKDGKVKNVIEGTQTFFNALETGYTTDKPNAAGSVGASGNLFNAYLDLDSIPPEERTEKQNKQLRGYEGLLARETIQTVGDGKGGTKTIRLPGLKIKEILNPNLKNNENKSEEEILASTPAKLSAPESKFLGNLSSATDDINTVIKRVLDGNLEEGSVNRNIIAALNIPGGTVLSGDAQIIKGALDNLADLTTRDRSGATAPPEERAFFFNAVLPKITDKDETIRFKIKRIITALKSNIDTFSQGRNIPGLPQISVDDFIKKNDEIKLEY